MKLKDQYTKELYRQFGYHATWLPSVKLMLGDIGVMDGNQFTRVSSLSELGIEVNARKDESSSNLEYASENGVSIQTKAVGQAKVPGSALDITDAGFVIGFTREKAILFQLTGVVNPSISNTIALGEEILARFKNKTWKKEWVVITELAEAESASIIVSNSANGKLELNVKGTLSPSNTDLIASNGGLSIVLQRDLGVKLISAENITPLFKLMGIKGWLKHDFGSKALSEDHPLRFVHEEMNFKFEEIQPHFDEE